MEYEIVHVAIGGNNYDAETETYGQKNGAKTRNSLHVPNFHVL